MAVDEAGNRMGGVRGTDGDPFPRLVDPDLVIRDGRAAVARRSLPGQHDLAVAAHRRQIPGNLRRDVLGPPPPVMGGGGGGGGGGGVPTVYSVRSSAALPAASWIGRVPAV